MVYIYIYIYVLRMCSVVEESERYIYIYGSMIGYGCYENHGNVIEV